MSIFHIMKICLHRQWLFSQVIATTIRKCWGERGNQESKQMQGLLSLESCGPSKALPWCALRCCAMLHCAWLLCPPVPHCNGEGSLKPLAFLKNHLSPHLIPDLLFILWIHFRCYFSQVPFPSPWVEKKMEIDNIAREMPSREATVYVQMMK